MIIDFSFKNFKSFADECNFTMLANVDKLHEDNLIKYKKSRLSKARMIYGANASGKTSFIMAMNFVVEFIVNSNYLIESTPIRVTPFKLCEGWVNKPSEFSITFVIGETKYYYEFSCNREKVLSERLDVFYSAKPTNIFKRTNTSVYDFNKDDEKLLKAIKERNLDNKLFLVTSASWNYEVTKPVVDYFVNTVKVVMKTKESWREDLNRIYDNGEVDEYKKFCLKMLNNADLSIKDFDMDPKSIKELNEESGKAYQGLIMAVANGNEERRNRFENMTIYDFKTLHEVIEGEEHKDYPLAFMEESLGTQQMFNFAPILYYVFKEGKVLFIDEIDKSLHPLIVKYLVGLFFNKSINPNNAQLIANTHDTNLLDLDMFRRDDIWFTERNHKTGKSELFSLVDFSVRASENIEKAYVLGRYGAIPFIRENR